VAVVVDANLLVSLGVDDARAPAVGSLFTRWGEEGESLHAPALMPYEAANALTRLVVAGKLPAESLLRARTTIEQAPITYHPLADAPTVIERALGLDRESAYDAAYVVLAEQLGAELWTLDGPLARNPACAAARRRKGRRPSGLGTARSSARRSHGGDSCSHQGACRCRSGSPRPRDGG